MLLPVGKVSVVIPRCALCDPIAHLWRHITGPSYV
jgi:hypothetical protein